ncbi:hypothetical protein Tco_0732025 [Tanacetum coccineum]
MDDPNITIEEYIRLEEGKACRRGKVYNWKTAKYDKIRYDEDVHDLISVETEFPAIVGNGYEKSMKSQSQKFKVKDESESKEILNGPTRTDNAKIIRKRSKPDKHGHGNE